MKKNTSLAASCILAALLVFGSAGCAAKDSSSAVPSSAAPPPSAVSSGGAAPSGQAEPADSTPSVSAAQANPSDAAPANTVIPAVSPDTVNAPDTGSVPGISADRDFQAIGDQLMQNDGLGSVKIRMTESALAGLLGQPDSKSSPELWGADGLEHSDWTYGADGLTVNMAKQPDDGEAVVFSIYASAPCTLSTQRGVTIGTPKEKLLSAYADAIDPEANPDMNSRILIGSLYGGIAADMDNGAVKAIFIGASAE